MKSFNLLISDAKDFMANELNRLFVWLLILIFANCIFTHIEVCSLKAHIKAQNKKTANEIEQVRKRVDYRYFNMTRSLEDLYGIKIDTYSGELKK